MSLGWTRPESPPARILVPEVPGFPDGLKVASDGSVLVSASTGVLIFDPEGSPVGAIDLPGAVNFAFGPDESVLYVTADTAVWAIRLHTEGAVR